MTSKLFRERAETIRTALVDGLPVADAAREHDVASRTLERWLNRGRRDPRGPYGAFAAGVDGARAARELPPADELPLDDAELRILIARAARKGNVRAMELAAKLINDDQGGDDDLGF